MSSTDAATTEIATLGGGCFWCLEAVFEQMSGVKSVVSGYAGGSLPNPNYEAVCGGDTGHAEVVQVSFDPAAVSFADLLAVFFAIHDPTTLNRQGADVGTQYRSVIFFHSPEQERIAREAVTMLTESRAFESPIVTQIAAAPKFFPAEDYHQGYFRANPRQSYCQLVVAPKVAKFRKLFPNAVKTT
jgi:peptide-methionine (S)-S-oxide reductase